MKKLLIALGLRAAPPPARPYLFIAATLGVVPAFLWMAWKNRRTLAQGVREAEHVATDLIAGRTDKRAATASATSLSSSI